MIVNKSTKMNQSIQILTHRDAKHTGEISILMTAFKKIVSTSISTTTFILIVL